MVYYRQINLLVYMKEKGITRDLKSENKISVNFNYFIVHVDKSSI